MADESSIIINIHAQSDVDEATKQIAEMLKAAKELADRSGMLATSQDLVAKSILDENEALKKNIESLKEQIKQDHLLEKASKSMRSELREVSQKLQDLAAAGKDTSAEFMLLADKAAQMTDTMGDTQAIINILASDTKNLDTAIGVGAGLTGAFSAATSAAALLGGESEALNEAFLKVQAALSIINGLQQMAAVTDKRSAANVVLRTALTKLFVKEKQKEAVVTGESAAASGADAVAKTAEAGATMAATTATKGFTAALLANPVMLIVASVAALAAGLVALKRHFEDNAVAARGYADALADLEYRMDNINKDTDYNARIAEAEGKTWQEVLEIRRQGAEEALKLADDTLQELLQKSLDANGKITDAEKETLAKAQDDVKQAQDNLNKINQDFTIKDIQSRRAAEEEKLAIQKEYAQKRREAAIEQYELELQTRQAFERLGQYSGSGTKPSFQEEEEEVEDIIHPETYREAMALKMQMEGASEDEIYQYRYNSQKQYLQARMALEEQGTQEWMELNNQLTELEIENAERVKEAQAEKYHQAIEIAQQALQFVADMTSEVFGIMNDQISSQLDNLHELYTTDAAEAAKDEKKKYITKAEYDKKERELKIKQAKLDKANAAFQIGINTAMAIMRIWADVPKADFGATTIALTAIAAALGATQLAAALAKPLPQYAKGRKGGKGEYAMVGERGAEIMYVPDGASIIPHNKINDPASWGAFGVPLPMPAMPTTDRDLMMAMAVMQATGQIDYDKMGAALAKHMPSQKAVSVNIDRNGIMVSNGHDTHTYLNRKYSGAW